MTTTLTPARERRARQRAARDGVIVYERPQGKYEKLAYARHASMLALASRPEGHPQGYYFDEAAGERAITFIEGYCKHHKGEWAGQPLLLEAWEKFVIRVAFGWFRADGTRLYRVIYLEVARKNGKSELIAAIGNYLLVADGEPGAEIYTTATKEEQAKIVWETSVEMVKRSPSLKRFVLPRRKSLTCPRTSSTYKPLGADSETLDGLNPHGHLCDEMHAHKKRGVWDVMITAMGARRQPMTWVITTAGIYDPESIGWEQHEHAQQVLDGVVEDDQYLAIIFAADEGDDPFAESTWAKANPNLGVSVKLDYLRAQAKSAQQTPSFLNTFLRLHLNVWTQQITRWISIESWNACKEPLPTLESWSAPELLSDDTVRIRPKPLAYLGVDLSEKLDMTALTVDIPIGDGKHAMYWFFWVPEELVKQRTIDQKKPDYRKWVDQGYLFVTPGRVVDQAAIIKFILGLRAFVQIRQLGFDPWGASTFAKALEDEGFSVDPDAMMEQLVEMRQGVKTLSEPCKKFEELVVEQKIIHGDHPIIRWMVNNAVIRRDANNNIAPDKASATGKIDGVVSGVMALARAIFAVVKKLSVYETRGVRGN